MSGGGRGLGSYQPGQAASYQPATYTPEVTGSVATPSYNPPPAPSSPAARGAWDWNGGTAITVSPGDTIDSIARRYGVPSAALAQSNGLNQQGQLYPGQRLVVPRYNVSGSPSHANVSDPATPGNIGAQRPAPSPALARPAVAQSPAAVHVVAPGENLTKIARMYRKSVVELAAANNIAPHAMLKMGDRITIPGVRSTTPAVASAAPRPQLPPTSNPALSAPGSAAVAAPRIAAAPATVPVQKMVAAEPAPSAHTITPAADNPDKDETASTGKGGSAGFRWPVRGRIITGFGPKPTGQQNDGINLAVPEGTPVKAAEDGVVAYAGSELKGYGNLVLVRHPNGYVTAYAHASELMVKRGDTIKRGQVIAKSGQTGNVTSPQLHFEIRKGASPVDPMQFLNGAT